MDQALEFDKNTWFTDILRINLHLFYDVIRHDIVKRCVTMRHLAKICGLMPRVRTAYSQLSRK